MAVTPPRKRERDRRWGGGLETVKYYWIVSVGRGDRADQGHGRGLLSSAEIGNYEFLLAHLCVAV